MKERYEALKKRLSEEREEKEEAKDFRLKRKTMPKERAKAAAHKFMEIKIQFSMGKQFAPNADCEVNKSQEKKDKEKEKEKEKKEKKEKKEALEFSHHKS
eukprot:Skav200604  [mRNA]  locus=scaffold879:59695:60241:- [translate_table: standard]